MALIIFIVTVIIVVIRYYARRNQMIRAEKQVQLFDELMERTRSKHKIIHELRKQQASMERSKDGKLTRSKVVDLAATSEEPFKITVAKVEICDAIDEYGRNIARIQVPRSVLYENAIEIKKIDEKDDDNGDDDDDDDDGNNDDNGDNCDKDSDKGQNDVLQQHEM